MSIENPTIQGLINALLIIIPAGVTVRVSVCALNMIHDDEERAKNKRRAINAVIFGIVAELAMIIAGLVYHYFS